MLSQGVRSMGKEKRELEASYIPLPKKGRFWVHSESCYTEEELNFREWILKIRSNSGIHPDYLNNPSSWFANDDQALVNLYEHAWFYSNAYKPRHVLSLDDFHVQPIDNQRLQWPQLYDLMQKVGDYLLLRNKELPSEHLNQPMNFVLLDVNNILKGLSQNNNIQQVKEQLESVTRYLRTIEKNISPLIGSDRLFLANFRKTVDTKIHPHLDHMLETQLLRDKLGELSKDIRKLSSERNRILHYALNANSVNPHSYEFELDKISDSASYPTQAAKHCAQKSNELVADPLPILHLTKEQLSDCPHFKLITMKDEILDHYAKAVSDLNELERFQKVIQEIMDLLGQAGEVYTVHQFKNQMQSLLTQIDSFIDASSVHIDEIIDANTQAYHKAIQEEQNLPFWKNWLTNEKEKLKIFIKNQDTLSQFPSSSSDLKKTNKALKNRVNEVVSHLNQPKLKETSFEAIAGQTQALNKLMLSMHDWMKIQHELKGLPLPQPPEPLKIMPTPIPTVDVFSSPPPPLHAYKPLFTALPGNTTAPCTPDNNQCKTTPSSPTQNSLGYLGLIALIPIGVIALYLVIHWMNKKDAQIRVSGTEEEFNKIKEKFEDLLAELKGFEHSEEIDLSDDYYFIVQDYEELIKKTKSNHYDVEALQDTYQELEDLYEEYCNPNKESLNF
ncbi:TPA: Dot/Icm T4SS effector RavR [Legionella pneumophila]|uniref:Dot/Icm T4SS effector RavR n=1 Tax=Legionella pneumophila TaxID=446 RepID=UPI0009AF3B8F|nr:Dot/Icm T4SS effector RavR [Legionella pneumophila]HAT1740059.1 Dot/Icm T4SS effector RavR [Legionella pneumophila]HAT1746056.1 Dot/Icm T4SS effector RavR [Legionella pneumophila]HAT1748987.1 Dot/Icm T4SS effector RavR [Legionella pneumophila]